MSIAQNGLAISGETPRLDDVSVLGPHGFIRVAYADWGPIDAERTVICVHGMSRNGRDFDVLAQRFVERGVRVVAPDLPGRGRSEWLGHPEDYATPLYLSAISALIARLGVREVDWVGSSLGGHIGMAFLSLSAAVPHLNTGKIRIVAMVEKTRYAAMPDIPTIGETVPVFEMSSWIGIFAPAGTPADIVAKLNEGIARVLTAEGVKAKLANLGLVVVAGKPAELAEVVKGGLKVRGELVKAAGIQPE